MSRVSEKLLDPCSSSGLLIQHARKLQTIRFKRSPYRNVAGLHTHTHTHTYTQTHITRTHTPHQNLTGFSTLLLCKYDHTQFVFCVCVSKPFQYLDMSRCTTHIRNRLLFSCV